MKVEIIPAAEFAFPNGREGSLFGSEWLNIFNFDPRLQVLLVTENGGQNIAACLLWDTRKKYFRSLITPPLMPNCGWIWLADFDKTATRISKQKEALSSAIEFLSSGIWSYWKIDFPSDNKDFQSAIWKGIHPKQKYTYRLPLNEDWRDSADAKLKNILKKQEAFSFERRPFNCNEFNEFHSVLATKGVKHVALFEEALTRPQANLFTVVGDEGKYMAMCLLMNNVAYYLAATNAKENNALSACGLAYCIEEARAKGAKIFDFEGSMIPEVERFFRGFGGDLVPYVSLEKGKGFLYSLRKFLRK